MRSIAKIAAVIGFFALAFVGWLSDVPVLTCALRAAGGGVVLYVVLSLGGTAAIQIIAEAAARGATEPAREEKTGS
jgi:hypothetical protein